MLIFVTIHVHNACSHQAAAALTTVPAHAHGTMLLTLNIYSRAVIPARVVKHAGLQLRQLTSWATQRSRHCHASQTQSTRKKASDQKILNHHAGFECDHIDQGTGAATLARSVPKAMMLCPPPAGEQPGNHQWIARYTNYQPPTTYGTCPGSSFIGLLRASRLKAC